jgi:hypothetical protein
MTRSLRRRYSATGMGERGGAEPFEIGVKAMEAVKSLEAQQSRTPQRMGVRNVSMVAEGTGQALPGPVACGESSPKAVCPITGDPGK